MKKSLILLIAAMFAFGTTAFAQKNIKLGHINSSELMQIMPGKDSAQAAFQAEVTLLEGELTAMQEELQKKTDNWWDTARETAPLWDNQVRMANLSVIGSHSVNGVSALHTDILEKTVFNRFYTMEPDKFNNKTNGISHRR